MKKMILTQRSMELFIGKMLRVGVFTACGIALFGGLLYVMQNMGHRVDYADFSSSMAVHNLSDIFSGLISFDPIAIIDLGLVILLATPVLRVVFSVVAFLLEKDYLYVVITLLVLFIILLNLFDGES